MKIVKIIFWLLLLWSSFVLIKGLIEGLPIMLQLHSRGLVSMGEILFSYIMPILLMSVSVGVLYYLRERVNSFPSDKIVEGTNNMSGSTEPTRVIISVGIISSIIAFFAYGYLSFGCGMSDYKPQSFCDSFIFSDGIEGFIVRLILVVGIFFLVPFLVTKNGRRMIAKCLNKFPGDEQR